MSRNDEYDIDKAVEELLSNKDIDTVLGKLAGSPPTRRQMSHRSQSEGFHPSEPVEYLLVGLDQCCVLAESTNLRALVEVARVYGDGVAVIYRNPGDMVPSGKGKQVLMYHPSRSTQALEEQVRECNSLLTGSVEEEQEDPFVAEQDENNQPPPETEEDDPYMISRKTVPENLIQQRLKQMRMQTGGAL